jgi:hypothetical protein
MSPEEVEELKSIGINLEALISIIRSQYELLKPVFHNMYNIDAEKRHEMALNASINKITNFAKDALTKNRLAKDGLPKNASVKSNTAVQ